MVTGGRGAGKGSSLQADSQKSKQVGFGVLRTPLAYFQCQVFFWLKSLALFSTCPVWAGHCQSPPAQSHQEHLCCSREQAGPGGTGQDWTGGWAGGEQLSTESPAQQLNCFCIVYIFVLFP